MYRVKHIINNNKKLLNYIAKRHHVHKKCFSIINILKDTCHYSSYMIWEEQSQNNRVNKVFCIRVTEWLSCHLWQSQIYLPGWSLGQQNCHLQGLLELVPDHLSSSSSLCLQSPYERAVVTGFSHTWHGVISTRLLWQTPHCLLRSTSFILCSGQGFGTSNHNEFAVLNSSFAVT